MRSRKIVLPRATIDQENSSAAPEGADMAPLRCNRVVRTGSRKKYRAQKEAWREAKLGVRSRKIVLPRPTIDPENSSTAPERADMARLRCNRVVRTAR